MENPFSIAESAVAMHEMYVSLRQAGFNRRESLALVSCLLVQKPLDP